MLSASQYNKLEPFKKAIQQFVVTGAFYEHSSGLIDVYEEITNSDVNRSCAGCVSAAIMSSRQMIDDYENRGN